MNRDRREQERLLIKVRATLGKPFYEHCSALHEANSDWLFLQFGNRSRKHLSKGNSRTDSQAVQLPEGTDSVTAAYGGDNSFSASSATTAITITPAATTMNALWVNGAQVGQSAQMSVYVQTTSSGAAPTGTVTFYANGTAIGGTTTYSPSAGGPGYSA